MITFPLKDRLISTNHPAFVVGIVNATPDSFYSESRGGLDKAIKLIEEGADIIDIGGESTRPGFTPVDNDEEIRRVIPIVSELRRLYPNVVLSVDTRHALVWKAAFENGADILNDVSSFEDDPLMMDEFFKTGAPVILTHRYLGDEKTRVTNPQCLQEISEYFEGKVKLCESRGLPKNKIVIDPGIGFGKTYEENVLLLKNSGKMCNGKYDVMMACSRKRVIGQLMNDMEKDRLEGTIKANLDAIKDGARFIRVHDVEAHIRAFESEK